MPLLTALLLASSNLQILGECLEMHLAVLPILDLNPARIVHLLCATSSMFPVNWTVTTQAVQRIYFQHRSRHQMSKRERARESNKKRQEHLASSFARVRRRTPPFTHTNCASTARCSLPLGDYSQHLHIRKLPLTQGVRTYHKISRPANGCRRHILLHAASRRV
jgi:hypothetical protein